MKTLMLFEAPDGSYFFETEGDQRRFQDVYINADVPENVQHTSEAYEQLQDDLADILLTEDGDYKLNELDEPTKDWDFFVRCGLIE